MSEFSCKHGNKRYETCEDDDRFGGLMVVEKQFERSFFIWIKDTILHTEVI